MIDLSLYLVLDPILCAEKGMVQTAIDAVEGGATVVQLRAPDWKKRAFFDCAVELKKALKPYGVPLIINDHVDVAIAVDADGVHVGQKDLPASVVRAMIGKDKILGLSVSNVQEAIDCDTSIVDYIGIGPIYTTSTKPDAAPPMGLGGFATAAAHCSLPNVAIGSVKAKDIEPLAKAGCNGIAVVSAICGQADVKKAAFDLKTAWNHAIESKDR